VIRLIGSAAGKNRRHDYRAYSFYPMRLIIAGYPMKLIIAGIAIAEAYNSLIAAS
jgi:hypothetical protein